MAAILYAIPTPLGGTAAESLPAPALTVVRSLRHFAVEDEKTARAFLKNVEMPCPIQEIEVFEIELERAVPILREGHSLGLLSEAGCPAIADPGSALVEAAHAEGFEVVPLVGPSSIVLALMASGLEGQRFAFCGYLPRDKADRARRIKELEERSRRERETQIFIETPYRNEALLDGLIQACAGTTMLCLATDLTLKSQHIQTRKISDWKKQSIGKRPTVFLLQAS